MLDGDSIALGDRNMPSAQDPELGPQGGGRGKAITLSVLALVALVVLIFFGTAWMGKRDRSAADLLPGQGLPHPASTAPGPQGNVYATGH